MNEFNSLCFWKRFYRNSVYNCITNLKIEKFLSKSILYFSNCEFQNAKELQFENIIKFLIVLPNRTMERCYKFAIKKIKITCYPSSFNFHSIFPGYTYPRLIVDRNLVAVQRSITRDFFFFSLARIIDGVCERCSCGFENILSGIGENPIPQWWIKTRPYRCPCCLTRSRILAYNKRSKWSRPIFRSLPYSKLYNNRGEEDRRWEESLRFYYRFDHCSSNL